MTNKTWYSTNVYHRIIQQLSMLSTLTTMKSRKSKCNLNKSLFGESEVKLYSHMRILITLSHIIYTMVQCEVSANANVTVWKQLLPTGNNNILYCIANDTYQSSCISTCITISCILIPHNVYYHFHKYKWCRLWQISW